MPDQSGHTTSRDFTFQRTDQSVADSLDGLEATPQPAYSTLAHEHYEAGRAAVAPGGSATSNQASTHDIFMRYSDFGTQQSSLPQQTTPAPFVGYSFSPGGPLAWNWDTSIDLPDYSNHYEPQGELVQELQNQQQPVNEFSIPLPVTTSETSYQSQQQTSSAQLSMAQNPLSPHFNPPHQPSVQTGMKRKAESEPNSAVSQDVSVSADSQQKATKRPNKSRSSSTASVTSPVQAGTTAPAIDESATHASTGTNTESQKRKDTSKGTGPQGRVIDVSRPRKIAGSSVGAESLPAGKVFPIQIGSELFRLSGASISSDAPSYFSHFFGEQIHNHLGRAGDIRTLYIDRDPDTFRDIASHLQGYHITPRDGEHFVRLFADAQFYSLPRLTKQLFSTDIFIKIGGVPFQIPRESFSSPGDSPNYFSLGFAQFFSTPSEVFPGLDRNALLRPPSISPPSVPNRCAKTFAELMQMLQGYTLDIRNEEHRGQLLRDARYFHLKGLEQKLIPCDISYNLKRNQTEILIRLEDIRQSGITFKADISCNPSSGTGSTEASTDPVSPASSLGGPQLRQGLVCYARPYTDDHSSTNVLVLETSSLESTTLHLPTDAPQASSNAERPTLNIRATFHKSTLARITSLFSVIASKMGLPATQPLGLMMMQSGGGVAAQPVSPANSGVSERRVRVRISLDCHIEIDNRPAEIAVDPASGRVGLKRVESQRENRIKPSREQDEHRAEAEPGQKEWIWGGAKESILGVGKDGEELEEELVVKRAQWRVRVDPVDGEAAKMQVILCGVKIEGYTGEQSRNQSRGFLGSAS